MPVYSTAVGLTIRKDADILTCNVDIGSSDPMFGFRSCSEETGARAERTKHTTRKESPGIEAGIAIGTATAVSANQGTAVGMLTVFGDRNSNGSSDANRAGGEGDGNPLTGTAVSLTWDSSRKTLSRSAVVRSPLVVDVARQRVVFRTQPDSGGPISAGGGGNMVLALYPVQAAAFVDCRHTQEDEERQRRDRGETERAV